MYYFHISFENMLITDEDQRYVITNSTIQFTSYVNDLLTFLSNTPLEYPSLTPLQPVGSNWIRNNGDSITFTCGVCEVQQGETTCDNDIDHDDLLSSRSFNVVTLDRK